MPQFEVAPRGAFSLEVENRYFGGWVLAQPGSTSIVMAFPVEGWHTSAAVVVSQEPGGAVRGTVHGAEGEDAGVAWRQALAALSLDFDGSGFAEVGNRDPVIGRLQHEHQMVRPVCFHSPYEAAAAFVIGHRISMAQQRAIRARLAREHGDAIHVEGDMHHAFPRPDVLLQLDAFGSVPGEKMERLHGIADAALAGRLDRQRLRHMPLDDAIRDLKQLRGVGDFIASAVVLRGAGLVDEVPSDDMTLPAVQHAYDLPRLPTHKEVLQRAEAWRPYRMWASVLLHISLRRSGTQFSGSRVTTRSRR